MQNITSKGSIATTWLDGFAAAALGVMQNARVEFMRVLLVGLSALYLFGCSDEGPTASISMPIYKDCIRTVENYAEYVSQTYDETRYKYGIVINEFDVVPQAHSEIVGFVSLYAFWSGVTEAGFSHEEDLEIMSSSIQAACYPESVMSSVISPEIKTSLDTISKRIGSSRSFTRFKGDSVSVFYYSNSYTLPGND